MYKSKKDQMFLRYHAVFLRRAQRTKRFLTTRLGANAFGGYRIDGAMLGYCCIPYSVEAAETILNRHATPKYILCGFNLFEIASLPREVRAEYVGVHSCSSLIKSNVLVAVNPHANPKSILYEYWKWRRDRSVHFGI